MKPESGEPRPVAQRLHPTSLLFSLATVTRNLLIPGLLVLWFASGGSREEIWVMALFVPAVIYEIIRYFTVRYWFSEDELVLREGIFTRNERHIPFARIQNIDLVQNPFHRLFRVAEIRVETASGSDPEAVMKVLSVGAVQSMRARIFGLEAATARDTTDPAAESVEAPGVDDTPAARTLLRLNALELARLGLISNRGMALVFAALGLAYQLDLGERFEKFVTSYLKEAIDLQPFLEEASAGTVVLLAIATGLLAIVGVLVLSILWTFVRLHGFALTRVGDDLRLECGLFTHRSATVPRHRIQLLSIQETLPHRWMGRVTVRIETAGGSADEGDSNLGRGLFLPLIRRDKLAEVLPQIRADLHLDELEWQPLAPGARYRMRIAGLIRSGIGTGILALIFGPWGALSLGLFVPVALINAGRRARFTRYARTPHGIWYRSGPWTRQTSVTSFPKIQVLSLDESPFDRRHGMAALAVDTAGSGSAGHKIRIPYLPKERAVAMLEEIGVETGRASLRW